MQVSLWLVAMRAAQHASITSSHVSHHKQSSCHIRASVPRGCCQKKPAGVLAYFLHCAVRDHGLIMVHCCRVPAYYALILRSLTVLEGLALSADKEYKLLAQAYPYMARRLLTDPAPQLR